MAIPGKEFVERFEAGEIRHDALLECADCEEAVQETLTGNRATSRGRVCSDCYFQELGAWVAEHPIDLFDPPPAGVQTES